MKNPITLAINLLIATIASGQTVTDIDGNTYPIIEINDQEWMGENLKTSRYNDGTPIQSFTEEDTWINLTDGAHGVPDVTDFEAHYGKLYNWHAVQTNKLCPAGWVIPSPTIWRELIESESLIAPQGNLNTLGTQLKSGRQVNHPDTPADAHPRWDEHDNRFGTDQFGFAALPAGNINPDGSFHKMGNYAYFWTSGSVSETHATAMVMLHSHKGLSTTSYPKAAGFSVRCIKSDDTIPPPPIQYTLTITTEGNGSTNPAAGTYDYEEGTTVDLTATAHDGWEFDKWVIDGEDFWDASTSITMNNDVNATAHFTESIIPPTQYTLTITTDGNGSTNPAAGTYDYEEGTNVDLTATADDGWEFDKWVIDGEDVPDASTSITMNNNVNATAHFTEIIITPAQYTLTIAAEGNGSTTPAAGTYDYEEGTTVVLTVTADDGWEFGKWVIDGSNIYNTTTEVSVDNNVSATAHFTEVEDENGLVSIPFEGDNLIINDQNHTLSVQFGGFFIDLNSTSLSDGMQNTQNIVSELGDNAGIEYAAKVCSDLTAHGFSDWYLPARDELLLMWENRSEIGNFGIGTFWSSSEINEENGYSVNFSNGNVNTSDKLNQFNVRCIRKN